MDNNTTRHPSYGVLTQEEFEKLKNAPLTYDAELARKGAFELIKQRRKGGKGKTKTKKPSTVSMFEDL